MERLQATGETLGNLYWCKSHIVDLYRNMFYNLYPSQWFIWEERSTSSSGSWDL